MNTNLRADEIQPSDTESAQASSTTALLVPGPGMVASAEEAEEVVALIAEFITASDPSLDDIDALAEQAIPHPDQTSSPGPSTRL